MLRKNVGSVRDEIDDRRHVHELRTASSDSEQSAHDRFSGGTGYDCGWPCVASPPVINDGDCQMWGNPIAEMMYEGLRYFAGKGRRPPEFTDDFGRAKKVSRATATCRSRPGTIRTPSRPVCAKPFETVISDINPSYDTDQLPGACFPLKQFTRRHLRPQRVDAGQTDLRERDSVTAACTSSVNRAAPADGAPTPKTVTSFGNIRGLAPEEPTKQGGYYSASVAYYGQSTT